MLKSSPGAAIKTNCKKDIFAFINYKKLINTNRLNFFCMGYGYYGFAPYVSVAAKKAKAQKKLAQLRKKSPGIAPLNVEGTQLAKTWWAKAWNANLEKYADFSNRIGRGRSYVRNGFVLDFKIDKGKVTALVQGTSPKPYNVNIQIRPMNKAAGIKIKQQCEGKIESLQELIEGRFPKELNEVFTAKGDGLFPTPQEIEFNCSCPDWAGMCKHVAATLYGVGVKLDHNPKLFFTLRNADMNDLITKAVKEKSKKMIQKSKKKTSRVISNIDAGRVFGIELEETDSIAYLPKTKNTTANLTRQHQKGKKKKK